MLSECEGEAPYIPMIRTNMRDIMSF